MSDSHSLVPVGFSHPLRKSTPGGFSRFFLGPKRVAPRKGGEPKSLNGALSRPESTLGTRENLVQRSRYAVPGYTLETLADRDDIIFAIRNTLKRAIGEMPWKIVPDVEKIKADLKRWHTVAELSMNYPQLMAEFKPQVLLPSFYLRATGALKDIISSEQAAGKGLSQNARLREFFDACLAYHEVVAESHILPVQEMFESPNPSAESSFRAFLNRIVDNLTLYDAAPIVKNPLVDGSGLGEMYLLPGQDVRRYRRPDLATPQPPEPAYDWYDQGIVRGYYNNDELVYIVQNEQSSGYGKPPIEVILEKMVGALYGDAYMVDFFRNNNTPQFVFDLGPDVSQDERDAIEVAWNEKVAKGLRRGLFIGSKEGVKGFIPLQQGTMRDNEVLEMLKYWANVKCAVYGLSLNDIGFTEDLHRTTSETQHELTQSRGIHSMAVNIQEFFNGEIVHGKMWIRNNALDPNDLTGYGKDIFDFHDVKFEFVEDDKEAKLEDAQRAETLIDGGVLSRNEVRRELGLPPVPGGDVITISTKPGIKVEDLPTLTPQEDAPPGGEGGGGEEGGEDGQPGGSDGKPPAPPHPPKPQVPGSGVQKRDLESLRDDLVKMLD
jgi:hypothetical protein